MPPATHVATRVLRNAFAAKYDRAPASRKAMRYRLARASSGPPSKDRRAELCGGVASIEPGPISTAPAALRVAEGPHGESWLSLAIDEGRPARCDRRRHRREAWRVRAMAPRLRHGSPTFR